MSFNMPRIHDLETHNLSYTEHSLGGKGSVSTPTVGGLGTTTISANFKNVAYAEAVLSNFISFVASYSKSFVDNLVLSATRRAIWVAYSKTGPYRSASKRIPMRYRERPIRPASMADTFYYAYRDATKTILRADKVAGNHYARIGKDGKIHVFSSKKRISAKTMAQTGIVPMKKVPRVVEVWRRRSKTVGYAPLIGKKSDARNASLIRKPHHLAAKRIWLNAYKKFTIKNKAGLFGRLLPSIVQNIGKRASGASGTYDRLARYRQTLSLTHASTHTENLSRYDAISQVQAHVAASYAMYDARNFMFRAVRDELPKELTDVMRLNTMLTARGFSVDAGRAFVSMDPLFFGPKGKRRYQFSGASFAEDQGQASMAFMSLHAAYYDTHKHEIYGERGYHKSAAAGFYGGH